MNYICFFLNVFAVAAFLTKLMVGGEIATIEYFLIPICFVAGFYYAHLIKEEEKKANCKTCKCGK